MTIAIYDINTFIAYCWQMQVIYSLLGNNQRNELHSIIFTALHTKVSSSTKIRFKMWTLF